MSVQTVLLPVFVLVGLAFALLLLRNRPVAGKEGGSPTVSDPFGLPGLFYVLIALALPLRKADLVIVLLSWVFVVAWFAHAGIFLTYGNERQRSLAWYASVLVLLAMWLYFALNMLLLI